MLQAVQRRAPLCHKLNSDCTLRTMLSLMLPQLTLDSQATKLQRNAGQPCSTSRWALMIMVVDAVA